MSKHRKYKKDKISDSTEELNRQNTADPSDLPSDEVSRVVDEIVATPKPKRIWEVDFLRGFMLLFVVWDHFMFDVNTISETYNTGLFRWLFDVSQAYYGGALRKATHDAFVSLFVFTSGISCCFSQNNLKRAVKMVVFALLLTAATYAFSSVAQVNYTIRFNVIHVIALSVLVWCGIDWLWKKCSKNWQKNLFGACMAALTVACLVVGYVAKYPPRWDNENSLWYFLVWHNYSANSAFANFMGGDYLPFLPDFGWFLVGAFLGKVLYKQKKTLFPSVNEKWVAPVTFCGRYSLWIYFGSQAVMYGFVYLFSAVLGWL